MAKNVRSNKRKEKKHVESGAAHIRSTFNNTIVTISDTKAMHCLGQVPAASVSAVPVRALRLLHRWLLNRLQKQLWNMAFVR